MNRGWKRFLSLILCLVLCAALLPAPAAHAADSGVYNGMKWEASGGNVTITGHTDSLPVYLTIPSSIDGKTVTSIGSGAFNGCRRLTSVTIPASVTSIGGYAFFDCTSLSSLTIPASVTSIGDRAFQGCGRLTTAGPTGSGCSIQYGWTTGIPDCAFSGCSGLKSVTIPASVTSIGQEAFSGCNGLTSMTIPANVTSIGNYAFSDCGSLKSVTIPASVTSIGWCAFSGCKELTSATIPASVTSISAFVFENCSSLTSVTIPASVTSIGERAFSDCSSLKSMTIPASVTSIGDGAFRGCSSLTGMTIPSSVTSIGFWAFENCSSLTNVTIPSSVTEFGDSAFSGCGKLRTAGPTGSGCSIEFGWKNSIPASVFSGCSSLTSVTIPASVTSIGYSAFSGCSGLKSVTIPTGVTSIAMSAFSGCSSLTSVTIPASVTSIDYGAFSNCSSLTSVTIPASVTSIGGSAFSGCSSLTSVTIPAGVRSIYNETFSGCSNLTSVTIPTGVEWIGQSAFDGCSSLTSVTIPASVRSIGNYAFRSCTSLSEIRFRHDADASLSLGALCFYVYPAVATSVYVRDRANVHPDIFCYEWAGSNRSVTYKSIVTAPVITSQPTNQAVDLGKSYSFAVKASGEELSYAWYYRFPGESGFTKSTVTAASYSNVGRINGSGMQMYCVVTDCFGNSVTSNTATLFVYGAPCQIVEQPKDRTVAPGASYTFSCGVAGEGLSYAWYYKFPGDSGFTKSSATGASYSNTARAAANGMRIYCVVTDKHGNTKTSRTASLTVSGAPCQIVEQPKNQAVNLDAAYTFSCVVAGEGLSYTWYYKFPGESGFTKSSCTTASYSNVGKINGSGMQMYCVVKDKYGNTKTSNTATLFVYGAPCQIVQQPQNQAVNLNAAYTFTCGVAGEGLSYAWYYKLPGASSFSKSSATGASYSNTARADTNGMQMYCVVRDKHGNTKTSNTVTLTVYGAPCQIVSQPQNQAVNLNATYTFTCGVAGEGLSYTWYYKFPGESGFTKSSCTTASYSNVGKINGSGMQMYCVVRDKYGNSKTSRTATLFVYGAPCQITEQPTSKTVHVGDSYSFTCGVAGEGLRYAWYYKFPGDSGFTKSSATGATYSNTARAGSNGLQMYCVVTDKYGNTRTSNTATLTVK